MGRRQQRHGWMGLITMALCLGPGAAAQAELVMKVLIVNPSKTEVKEFNVRSPLPPEVKPEHVLNADGFHVEYDSQASVYMLVGTVTLKPREALTKHIVLEDVWVIPDERLTGLRGEVGEILKKLAGSTYTEQGRVLAAAIERNVSGIETSQQDPSSNPQQHISLYRENTKTLQMVESDLVSLRQLMVMASLHPSPDQAAVAVADTAGKHDTGRLSILATWRLIFIILGLLGFVSLSFFLVWQRQLKFQLAKQQATEPDDEFLAAAPNGHDSLPQAVVPNATPRLEPKSPLSP